MKWLLLPRLCSYLCLNLGKTSASDVQKRANGPRNSSLL
jgi:hypothetical protein